MSVWSELCIFSYILLSHLGLFFPVLECVGLAVGDDVKDNDLCTNFCKKRVLHDGFLKYAYFAFFPLSLCDLFFPLSPFSLVNYLSLISEFP